jgi:hypothetical protein
LGGPLGTDAFSDAFDLFGVHGQVGEVVQRGTGLDEGAAGRAGISRCCCRRDNVGCLKEWRAGQLHNGRETIAAPVPPMCTLSNKGGRASGERQLARSPIARQRRPCVPSVRLLWHRRDLSTTVQRRKCVDGPLSPPDAVRENMIR